MSDHVEESTNPVEVPAPANALPESERVIALLDEFFLTRRDLVAVLGKSGRPFPVEPVGSVAEILRTHVLGEDVPEARVRFRGKKGAQSAFKGRFRVGSYSTAADDTVRWLCLDFDGPGHATALADAVSAALATRRAFERHGLPTYLERSGSAKGWHLWTFFREPIPARLARRLAFALIPDGILLDSGERASAVDGRGIEVFPKQDRLTKGKTGNMVWLPWWSDAAPDGNLFYRITGSGELVAETPGTFAGVEAAEVERVLAEAEKTRVAATAAVANKVLGPSAPGVSAAGESNSDWSAWRRCALSALDLGAIYGPWLTGVSSGEGWMQARDPSSPTGDREPSAGVADGTGVAERGSFHSFISGETLSVFDFLVRFGGAEDHSAAVRIVAERSGVAPPIPRALADVPPSDGRSPAGRRSLPRIQVNNRQLRHLVADAWAAVQVANAPPSIFLRSAALVRLLRDEKNGISIDTMDEPATYGLLARVADWTRSTDEAEIDTLPVKDVARDMLAYPDPRLPPLEGVITSPVFSASGELIDRPGYHREDAVWLEPDPGLDVGEVPAKPSPSEVADARALLVEDLLGDFPFVDPSDLAHAVAALVLPFARRLVPGCTPMHLIEAPEIGSGKGLLSKVINIVATGTTPDGHKVSNDDKEVGKMLAAELLTGRPVIVLDNADDRVKLHSPTLAGMLTMEKWTDRILGQSRMLNVENRALWIMTGNNPLLSDELIRRCVRVRIDSGIDRPWRRGAGAFRHPDLVAWARENRSRLVRAALVLVRAWIAAGRPEGKERLGSFEKWSDVVGGILANAGIPGFLASADDLFEAVDSDRQVWEEFAAAWWDEFRDLPKKVADLNRLCEDRDLMGPVRGDGGVRSQQTRLGRALQRARDRIFDGRRIARIQLFGAHKGGVAYALKPEPASPEPANDRRRPSEREASEPGPAIPALGNGDLWGPLGTSDFSRSPSASASQDGVSAADGDLGDLDPNPYARMRARAHAPARTRAHPRDGDCDEVPKVPIDSGSLGSSTSSSMGTSKHAGPQRSPKVPIADDTDTLDLVDFDFPVDEPP